MEKRIAIINQGEWGMMEQSQGDYDPIVGALEGMLSTIMDPLLHVGREPPKGEVRVIDDAVEAQRWLRDGDIAIFITRGMISVAKRLAAERPRLKVFLFSGLVPNGEVVFAPKGIIPNEDALEQLIFHSF